MKNKIKLTIAYTDDDNLNEILMLLEPKLKNAKIRKNENPKPYKHAYITIKNSGNP